MGHSLLEGHILQLEERVMKYGFEDLNTLLADDDVALYLTKTLEK